MSSRVGQTKLILADAASGDRKAEPASAAMFARWWVSARSVPRGIDIATAAML
jgi:hypothetical protein